MSFSTGVNRIAQITKWLGRVIFVFLVLDFLWEIKPWEEPEKYAHMDGVALFIMLLPIIFLVITEGLAWILEGFSHD